MTTFSGAVVNIAFKSADTSLQVQGSSGLRENCQASQEKILRPFI